MKYYIQDSRQVVGNSMLWWKPNGAGYTCDLLQAEIFNEEEAVKICLNRDTDIMWKKDIIDLKIQYHVDIQSVNT